MSVAAAAKVPAPATEPTTDYSVFEGLFAKVLKPSGKFADDLRGIGFDPDRPVPKYPTRVWNAALQVAARHVCPGQPHEQAMRSLGKQFIQGFYGTIVGHMIRVTLPILGPLRVLQRLPKNYEMVRTDVKMDVTQTGPKQVQIDVKDAHAEPHFTCGLIEAAAQNPKIRLIANVARHEGGTYTLQVRWEDL